MEAEMVMLKRMKIQAGQSFDEGWDLDVKFSVYRHERTPEAETLMQKKRIKYENFYLFST